MSLQPPQGPVVAYRTPADVTGWKRWWPHSPLARIVLYILLMALMLGAMSLGAAAAGLDAKDAPAWPKRLGILARQLVPFVGAYLLLVWWIEKRKPDELAWRRVLRETPIGLAAGFLFVSLVVGVLWLAGTYQVTGTNPEVDWVKPLLITGLGTAVAEEILFRGVLFRIAEEGLGTWAALAISALLFGGVHAMNPNASWWSSLAIAIEAGVLLGLAYHLTRSLPLVIGIHMAWNFTLGTLYGIAVSGTTASGFLVAQRQGPEWLTGGAFGAEASVVAVAISLAASVAMAVYAVRRGTVVVRPWRQRPMIDPNLSQAT